MTWNGPLSLALLAASVALGGLREFLFVNLNYQLDFLEHSRAQSYAHSAFQRWAAGLDAGDLRQAKWLLALAFVAITLLLTVAMARIRLGDSRLNRPIILAFAALGASALALHLLSGQAAFLSLISVQLLHALQYPVPLLLVWALTWKQGS